jgi:hypothetical protein
MCPKRQDVIDSAYIVTHALKEVDKVSLKMVQIQIKKGKKIDLISQTIKMFARSVLTHSLNWIY